MVLEIGGYSPSQVGLRKFLSTTQKEVLECLWGLGEKGGDAVEIRRRLASQGCSHSLLTVRKVLDQLRGMGVVGVKVTSSSAVRVSYYPVVSQKDIARHLVGRLVAYMEEAMPDTMRKVEKGLSLT